VRPGDLDFWPFHKVTSLPIVALVTREFHSVHAEFERFIEFVFYTHALKPQARAGHRRGQTDRRTQNKKDAYVSTHADGTRQKPTTMLF